MMNGVQRFKLAAKKPYKIVKMTADKFVSIRKLANVVNVRKVSDDGEMAVYTAAYGESQ